MVVNFLQQVRYAWCYISVIIGILAYILFIGDPQWGTNDDVGMNLFAIGSFIAVHPSPELVFISPIFGLLANQLGKYQMGFSMNAALYLLFASAGMVSINYSLIQVANKSKLFPVLLVLLNIAVFMALLVHLQFTIVAGILSIASVILGYALFSNIEKPLPYWKILSFVLLISGAFIMRREAALMILALSCPTFVYLALTRSKECVNTRITYINLLAIVLALVCAFALIYKVESSYYKSEEWTNWKKLNTLKAEFIDFGRVKYQNDTKKLFEKNGLTKVDFEMITTWNYFDQEFYDQEKIANFLTDLNLNHTTSFTYNWFSTGFECILVSFNNLLHKAALLMMFFLGMVLFHVIWILTRQTKALDSLLILAPSLFVYAYIVIYLHRPELRVTALIVMFVAINLMYLGLKNNCWDKLFKISWLRSVAMLLFALYMLTYFVDGYIQRKNVISMKSRYISTIQMVEDWTNKLPAGSVINIYGASFCYECLLPFRSIQSISKFSGVVATGWPNQTPHQISLINSLGLPINGYYRSLMSRPHVFFYNLDERTQSIISNFYIEKFNVSLSFSNVDNVEGLTAVSFNKH